MQHKNIALLILFTILISCKPPNNLDKKFTNPPESAKPWTLWHWRKAAVSKEGITADLEAMKEIGLGGAFLIPVQGPDNPPMYEPVALQLTPYWWELIDHAMHEAKRLDLKLAMHACDGFAVAGGPWITPEMSMQKIVWSDTIIFGNQSFDDFLPQPEDYEGYYKDIAIFAFPVRGDYNSSTRKTIPMITSSKTGGNWGFLISPNENSIFSSKEPCWIQYSFKEQFTCRSIKVHTQWNNLQASRLLVKASNDGKTFWDVAQLEPPRQGWQNYVLPTTHSIPTTKAKYFRFYYNPEGTEPGAEDLDVAKFKQSLKIVGLELFGMPRINQYEGKNGEVWRVGKSATQQQLPDSLCIDYDSIVEISDLMSSEGKLNWETPEGNWMILRMGQTSTGHTNYIGGGGLGLECDKFSTEAAKIQFNNWFAKFFEKVDKNTAHQVLKMLFIDSWEAGSQNWSSVFREEFKKRNGYDIVPYLPVFAGFPINNTDESEKILKDVRETIATLMVDNFFGTMADLARKKGCVFSAESVSPTFVSDGLLHFKKVDIPTGEFWHNSPTHDKPNDMLDAIHAAHINEKKIIQAESFTTLRMAFNEHPGMLKPLLDRNYALGINKIVFHVMVQNPWMDRQPGMTLDGVGLYFQRDQVWWDQANTWIDYMSRCQTLLQEGLPVADIAVFTGEEIPRRALTPDRLVDILPGLFDPEVLEQEAIRQKNETIPFEKIALDVSNTVNAFKMENWIDPLNGYKYDCINKDALLNLATVKNGKIVLPSGVSYEILVVPGKRKMDPNYSGLSKETTNKLIELAQLGGHIIWKDIPRAVERVLEEKNIKNNIITGKYTHPDFSSIGTEADCYGLDPTGQKLNNLAWCHRKGNNFDIYFISNQLDTTRQFKLSLRSSGKTPKIFDPVSGQIHTINNWKTSNNRTELPLILAANASIFIVLEKTKNTTVALDAKNWLTTVPLKDISTQWDVHFYDIPSTDLAHLPFDSLSSWSSNNIDEVKYYSGKAKYSKTISIKLPIDKNEKLFLEMDNIYNIATVSINGFECGTVWTPPYRVDISNVLKPGDNKIEILVANTWLNRLLGDYPLPDSLRRTWTTAPYRFKDLPLQPSGLLGSIQIVKGSE